MGLLDDVTTGIKAAPARLMVWGPPGVGKSTFAASCPGAIFIEAEKRTNHLDVCRLFIDKWEKFLEVLREVYQSDQYRTVVIDTIDGVESLLFASIALEAGCASHEDIGGGFCKFRVPMLAQWKRFIAAVDALTGRGIQVVLLAHAEIKQFSPPDGVAYDRYVIKMDARGGNYLIENMDLVGYAKFAVAVTKGKGEMKAKATSSGKRRLQFKFSPVYPTKQGIPAPDECDLSWEAFVNELAKCSSGG